MKGTETVHVCRCGEHGIAVTRIDWNDDGSYVDVQLASWLMAGHGDCRCWSCRLRQIWYIARHGTPWPDGWMSIDREEARALAKAIEEAAR